MKVKFEIEMPESAYKMFQECFDKPKLPIDLGELLQGKQAFLRSMSRHKEPIYGPGQRPVGFELTETIVELVSIKPHNLTI